MAENMETYTRTYPRTGSTLTIKYPPGLILDIIEDPRSWYRLNKERELNYTPYDLDDQGNKVYRTDEDYARLAYADLLLIPANGSFIKKYGDYHEVKTIRKYSRPRKDDPWKLNKTNTYETTYSADAELTKDRYHVGFEKRYFFERYITIINNSAYSASPIVISEALEENEINSSIPKDLSTIYSYTTIERHITITIYGEEKYFKSDADFYCIFGSSDEDVGQIFCNSYFEEDKQPVGGIIVSNKDEDITEISPVSLLKRCDYYYTADEDGEIKVMDFSNCFHFDVVIPQYSNSEHAFNPNDRYYCEGFRFERSLDTFPNRYLISNDESVDFTYRNSYISFVLEPLVMISDGWTRNGYGYHYYVDKNANDDTVEIKSDTCLSYDENNNMVLPHIICDTTIWEPSSPFLYELGSALWQFIRYDQYIVESVAGGDAWRYPQYYITTESAFCNNGNLFNYTDENYELEFSGYFTTENGNSTKDPKDPQQYLIAPWEVEDKDSNHQYIPIYEYGTVLYPVFFHPQCAYVKFNCDRGADKKNVLGNYTGIHSKIIDRLRNTYGENFLRRNIFKWDTEGSKSVMDEVIKLKNSKAKFKIVFVNSHGGKNSSTDTSYALMSLGNEALGIPRRIFQYKHLKHLLTNMRPNEYYFFRFAPCFSGGMMEKIVHNQKDNPNYTSVLPSEELQGNFLVWYSDCSNSPSWGILGGINAVSNLYDLESTSFSYKDQAESINKIVQECRTKNVQLLANFLQKHYEFMKTTLLDVPSFTWNQKTYNESVNNTSNVLIWSSRTQAKRQQDPNDWTKWEYTDEHLQQVRSYPIVFLFSLLQYMDSYANLTTRIFTKDKFIESPDGYVKFATGLVNYCDKAGINLRHKGNPAIFEPQIGNLARYNFETRELFIQHFDFFFEFYRCWIEMGKNAQDVYALNNYPKDWLNTYLLDDIPGVVFHGSDEFGECVFPKFPGYDPDKKISEEKLQSMIFNQPIGGMTE